MNLAKRVLLVGTAIAVLGASSIVACKRDYNTKPTEPTPIVTPAPTPTETPIYTLTPTPEPTPEPAITPTPTLENKIFEFVFPSGTPEQYETFSRNALEDYRTVLNVYGINEKDARMKVLVWENKQGYTSVFDYGGKTGTGVGMGIDDFVTDRREVKHEMAHAINHTLFPTYHLWFDEGMAMYASGEIETFIKNGAKEKEYPKYKASSDYWNSDLRRVPGHAVGYVFFVGLIADYDLTPEQNRTALGLLKEKHSETGNELNKFDIKNAYETALGKSLDPLFDLLSPGVKLLYSTDPTKAGIKGAEINKIIRSEFGIAN